MHIAREERMLGGAQAVEESRQRLRPATVVARTQQGEAEVGDSLLQCVDIARRMFGQLAEHAAREDDCRVILACLIQPCGGTGRLGEFVLCEGAAGEDKEQKEEYVFHDIAFYVVFGGKDRYFMHLSHGLSHAFLWR